MQALPGTLACGCCDCRYGHDRWALRTRLTCSIRLRISASTHMRTENVAAFEKIAFFCSKCYYRNIPNTKGGKRPCQDRHGAVEFLAYHRSIHSVPTGARIPSRSCWRWTNTRSFGWLTWSSKPTSSVPRRCRVVRLGDLKEKKRPHHVEKQLTNNSCWKGNWKTTSFNRDNGKLKISEVEQTALYLQSLQIESCLLLAIRFSDTDSWCPCILVLGYSIFSWLFRNCVYSSKKSITDAL